MLTDIRFKENTLNHRFFSTQYLPNQSMLHSVVFEDVAGHQDDLPPSSWATLTSLLAAARRSSCTREAAPPTWATSIPNCKSAVWRNLIVYSASTSSSKGAHMYFDADSITPEAAFFKPRGQQQQLGWETCGHTASTEEPRTDDGRGITSHDSSTP